MPPQCEPSHPDSLCAVWLRWLIRAISPHGRQLLSNRIELIKSCYLMGKAVKRAFYAQRHELCTGVLRLQHVSTRGSSETKPFLSVTYLARSEPGVALLSQLFDKVKINKKTHQAFQENTSLFLTDLKLCSCVLFQVYLIRPGERTCRELSCHLTADAHWSSLNCLRAPKWLLPFIYKPARQVDALL